ncbi:lipopolysaccharide heptosyltransferase family protein [Mesorhizobium waimense]|uniref:Lipopolysaccharide heptosyltransferase family protein n=1 Tax=Mesorhizobium waimense TaxID=1300307 RepID=A0A3A5KUY0_9HYPH|nr:glycosyltransferase family 9 protein [Mesorhizobium waimense]RJT40290.1 lipopolysaccharide heptosyltransferase family protein [Mesorhizobium waimense]
MKISKKPVVLVLTRNEKLGDAILRIPVYRALRLALPTHRIVCASDLDTVWRTTLAPIQPELIDEILVDQRLSSISQMRALIRRLGTVDLVLDLRSSKETPRSYVAAAGLPARYIANSVGFALRRNIAGFFEPRPPTNALRWHRMVELATGRLLPFDAKLPVFEKARDEALRLIPSGERFIGLSPGPTMNKFWHRQKWTDLARHIASDGIIPAFLLGPQETEQRNWIEKDGVSKIVDVGSIQDSALLPWLFHALADRAICIVAAESGLGHLAATRQGALLTLAGPSKARLWRPLTPYHWLVEAREFGSMKTEDIPLDVVVARVQEIVRWASNSAPGPSPHDQPKVGVADVQAVGAVLVPITSNTYP